VARKDLGLAVDMARSHDVPVPATRLLHQLYNACASLGEGSSDFAAIVKLYGSWTRTEVKGGEPISRLRAPCALRKVAAQRWPGQPRFRWITVDTRGRRSRQANVQTARRALYVSFWILCSTENSRGVEGQRL
jgi:hypothetical protein